MSAAPETTGRAGGDRLRQRRYHVLSATRVVVRTNAIITQKFAGWPTVVPRRGLQHPRTTVCYTMNLSAVRRIHCARPPLLSLFFFSSTVYVYNVLLYSQTSFPQAMSTLLCRHSNKTIRSSINNWALSSLQPSNRSFFIICIREINGSHFLFHPVADTLIGKWNT